MRTVIVLTLALTSIAFGQQKGGDSSATAKKKLLPASSAAELDQLWASFTKDKNAEAFIRIFKSLAYCAERKDVQTYIVGATAKNSLIANGKKNSQIIVLLQTLGGTSGDAIRTEVQDILKKIENPKGLEEYRKEVNKIVAEIADNNKKN